MTQWDYVTIAYAVTLLGAIAVTAWAWAAMRQAEGRDRR